MDIITIYILVKRYAAFLKSEKEKKFKVHLTESLKTEGFLSLQTECKGSSICISELQPNIYLTT